MHVCLIRFDTKVALQVFWLVEQNSPVEDENSSDDESRDDVSQDPHQTVFIRSLREEKRSVIVWHTSGQSQGLRFGICAHHEEQRPLQRREDVQSVRRDRMNPGAPRQRIQPRLTDHIQVSADVHGGVLSESTDTFRRDVTGPSETLWSFTLFNSKNFSQLWVRRLNSILVVHLCHMTLFTSRCIDICTSICHYTLNSI